MGIAAGAAIAAVGTIAAAGISAVSQSDAANKESKAATSAAQIQANAAEQASQNQLNMFSQAKEEVQPFATAGQNAVGGLEELLGLQGGGGMNSSQISSFLSSLPGYQFTLQQGEQATQSNQAAQGLAVSGSAIKAADQYATGLASNNYENYVQQYLNTANLGAGAAESVASMGLQSQNIASQYATSGAAASAGGVVGAANAGAAGTLGVANAANTGLSGLNSSALLLGMYNGGMFGGSGASAASSYGNQVGGSGLLLPG